MSDKLDKVAYEILIENTFSSAPVRFGNAGPWSPEYGAQEFQKLADSILRVAEEPWRKVIYAFNGMGLGLFWMFQYRVEAIRYVAGQLKPGPRNELTRLELCDSKGDVVAAVKIVRDETEFFVSGFWGKISEGYNG